MSLNLARALFQEATFFGVYDQKTSQNLNKTMPFRAPLNIENKVLHPSCLKSVKP